jgi:uncharacterized coiled-coil protein SlyX
MGSNNVALGNQAGVNITTGSDNICIGVGAGIGVTTGNNNIRIGDSSGEDEAATIRIGRGGVQTKTIIAGIFGATVPGGTAVVVNSEGQLGTTPSSERFKDEIKPMDKISEAILALKPVTFHYKNDAKSIAQFGLIAEEVAEVNSDLVVRDEKGEIYTVRYDAVNAMVLNEFLKEHKKLEAQQATITELKSTVAQQQKGMEILTARLKEQAAQIQKVTAQIEIRKSAPQIVINP